MTFLNPILAAIGLACIALPIIIHILMRRRRQPVRWAAMKFLLEAYQRQRRRMNLEQLLLLACRCLLVALLAVAVGKPVLGSLAALAQGPRTLYMLIDNSLASGARPPGEAGAAIESNKAAAIAMLNQLDPARGDRVAIITLAEPADALVLPATADHAAAADLIRALRPLDSRADVAGALAKVREESRRTPDAANDLWLALFSELRAGSTDLEAALTSLRQAEGSTHILVQSPATAPLDNIAITAVQPARSVLLSTAEPGAPRTATTNVRVALRRSGAGLTNAAVSTISADAVTLQPSPTSAPAPRTQTTVNWTPGQDTAIANLSVEVPVPAQGSRGPVILRASIDADAVAADNTFRRPIITRERLEIALLAPGSVGGQGTITTYTPADWLALALAPEADPMRRRQSGEIRVTAIDPARALSPPPGSRSAAGQLADFDAILLPRPDLVDAAGWRMVRAAADLGALLIISPPAGVQSHAWSDAMLEGLGLEWQIAREATAYTPSRPLAADRPAASGVNLLDLLSAELPELLKRASVSQSLTITAPQGSLEPLINIDGGAPFLVMAQAAPAAPSAARGEDAARAASRGVILFFTSAIDLAWTDLPTKPLMVPLIQELVRQGVGRSNGPRTVTAGALPPSIAGAVELAPINDPASGELAPGPITQPIALDATGRPAMPVRSQGLFAARTNTGATAAVLAYNADPRAGLTTVRSRDEIARWLSPVGDDLTWIEPGAASAPGGPDAAPTNDIGALARDRHIPPISFPLLIAALVIAAVETMLARWFSHARVESGLATPGTLQTATGAAAA